jgi:uncharacterized protein YsxB (DUF464 family)
LGEILVQRDESNRVVGVVVRGVRPTTTLGTSVSVLMEAAATGLAEYLHVAVESSFETDMTLVVDRGDPHLDRELDAILETLVVGFRVLERDYPKNVCLHEETVGVEVL